MEFWILCIAGWQSRAFGRLSICLLRIVIGAVRRGASGARRRKTKGMAGAQSETCHGIESRTSWQFQPD